MSAPISGTIFDIKRYAINDGPGIRTTVFLKGCPLSCWWCHNPESQSQKREVLLHPTHCITCLACMEACPHGAIQCRENGSAGGNVITTIRQLCTGCGTCTQACYAEARQLSGRMIAPQALMDIIERDIPFYDQSGGGVTFSGGEPLFQARFLLQILQMCRQREIHTVVDTSGFARWETLERVQSYIDLFLYDLKHFDEAKHQQFTGVSNRLILENLTRLSELGRNLVVRIPLIPGVNDDRCNLEQSAAFLAGLPKLERVDLMAYHKIGIEKYTSLGKAYRLPETQTPTQQQVIAAAEILRSFGLQVQF